MTPLDISIQSAKYRLWKAPLGQTHEPVASTNKFPEKKKGKINLLNKTN